MLTNAILFLLEALLNLMTIAFLLRFYFQLTRVSFQSQLAQMIVVVTNFAVKPVRRVLPSLGIIGLGKIDVSTLLLAYITQLLLTTSTLWLKNFPILLADSQVWLGIFGIAFISIIIFSVSIFLYSVLLQAVLSWINPHTPIAPILHNLNKTVLFATRKIIPPVANFDLSPLAFILVAQLLLTTLFIPLKNQLLLGLYA